MSEPGITIKTEPIKGASDEQIDQVNEIHIALAKAQEGDFSDIDRLYDKFPKLVRYVGEETLQAEKGVIKWFGEMGKGPGLYLNSMREDLGYTMASGLERLLIDRIVVCWLRVQQAEMQKDNAEKGSVTLSWATVWGRRLQMANRNFLSACKTLAQVRRLLRPRIAQVNVGGQQINVAQVEAGDGD